MNLIKKMLFAALLLSSAGVFARGGDDAGNGGFAYKQSIKILKMATEDLEHKIANSDLQELINYPERRGILQNSLNYDNIRKNYFWDHYRDGKKLAMDYDVKSARVIVLKSFFQAFAGKTDTELEDASLEVQKRLLHEAAHLWGYQEDAAEKFSIAFLNDANEGAVRPTNAISIAPNFCSCINGKSDIVNNCDAFCATKPVSSSPILYVDTILGPEILWNPKLGNLYNWCTKQLANDETTPQCILNATDGVNEINVPINIEPNSNSFTSNISSLGKERTWILKLLEIKTGSNAQSKEFQIRRKMSRPSDTGGALKILPVNQYTCFLFGGKTNSNGAITRTSYTRVFYYFMANETPPPVPSAGGINDSLVVCHDEQLHPGSDSLEYERLELIPGATAMWDKSDSRFATEDEKLGKLRINQILEDRLASEYNIPRVTLNLFNLISYPNSPATNSASSRNVPLGYIMAPFTNTITGKSFCPVSSDYTGNQPIFNLLGNYMDDTEGLYVAEKEAEAILDNGSYKTFYGTMFVHESTLKNYGFYINSGVKVRANENSLHTKTIYYYWPTSKTTDPLIQGGRKFYTVRTPDTLQGSIPGGYFSSVRTSDKRIGCVPKVEEN